MFGDRVFGQYGFVSGFYPDPENPDAWASHDVIGIDLGCTLLMAENARTGLVWDRFMANPEVQTALQRAAFTKAD